MFSRCWTYLGQWPMMPTQWFVWHKRYTPLLKRAKLATVALICCRGVPPFSPVAHTTLVDRWRPETHSFHLPCGEMTLTIQDASMILGLLIREYPEVQNMNLSTMCRADKDMWLVMCPFICFYAVEYHLPHRVARSLVKSSYVHQSPSLGVGICAVSIKFIYLYWTTTLEYFCNYNLQCLPGLIGGDRKLLLTFETKVYWWMATANRWS